MKNRNKKSGSFSGWKLKNDLIWLNLVVLCDKLTYKSISIIWKIRLM